MSLALGPAALQAWLPAWLFALGIPLGALPLVMGLELAGVGRAPLATALRRLLPALPLACLLSVPLLLHPERLWTHPPLAGFAGQWFRADALRVREIAFLAVWAVLGVVFAVAPRRDAAWRRAVAVFGLMLHLSAGTLAAVDWAMSVEPGINSSVFGVLLLSAQCSAAVAAAGLLAAVLGDAAGVRAAARPMLVLLGLWLFLQFSQYLIVWSGDLPQEIVWYQQRSFGLGLAAVLFAGVCCAVVLLLTLPRRLASRPAAVASAAALVLVMHAVEMWWLVAPAWLGHFAVRWTDLLLMLGLAVAVGGCARAVGPRRGHAHGRA